MRGLSFLKAILSLPTTFSLQGLSMTEITIEHNVSPAKLDAMDVDSWPVWEKEVSTFDWHYDKAETCYILEGEAIVTSKSGEAITIQRGDLVRFPVGLDCSWKITEAIEKHYIYT